MASVSLFHKELSSANLKYFNTILHLLQKISKDFIIEKNAHGHIVLQSLNEAKSVFINIEFKDNFWINTRAYNQSNSQYFSCKMPTKSVCSIFRNLKKVSTMSFYHHGMTLNRSRDISLNNTQSTEGIDVSQSCENEVVFKFLTQDDVSRKHSFTYQDAEPISAVFDDAHTSIIQTQPKVFSSLMEHLHQVGFSLPCIVAIYVTYRLQLLLLVSALFSHPINPRPPPCSLSR